MLLVRDHVVVFSDGAAKGNPGPGGWGAIVVTPDDEVAELGGGSPHTTNNRMELTGAVRALESVSGASAPISIYTDSSYVIKGITQWVWSWQRRGWKTAEGGDVLNRDLWEQLSSAVATHGRQRIAWHWVRGHDGTPGNERVDEIAVAFSREQPVALYNGRLTEYGISILTLPDDTSVPPPSGQREAGTRKGPAHSYLSVVDGVLERHATWAECERRVKGRAGARFRKALTAAEEAAIVRGWGFPPPPH
jgi:ribonuclease HI